MKFIDKSLLRRTTARALLGGIILSTSWQQPSAAQTPDFQTPFPCGQIWDASTYPNHAPDENSLDLIERDQNGNSIGEGLPVVASAAGTVVFDKTWPSGPKERERWVMIDHGDGWRTHYIHNHRELDRPPLSIGRRIAQGETIGRTSNSGGEVVAVHQHYTQVRDVAFDAQDLASKKWRKVLFDGDTVRARFDGLPVKTHKDNPESWEKWNKAAVEKIRSHNCAGQAYARWTSNGENYILRYNPAAGLVRVNALHPSSDSNPTLQTTDWGMNWHTLMPFYSRANDRAHLLLYNFATGKLSFRRMTGDNAGSTHLQDHSVYAGWTHMLPVYFDRTPHFVSYDSRYGFLNVDRIHPTNDGFTEVKKTTIETGYTNLISFEEGPRRYLFMYKGGSGKMNISSLTFQGGSSNQTLNIESQWSADRRKNWSHFALLIRDGKRYLFGYDSSNGDAKIWSIRPDGQGLESHADFILTPGYTTVTPYSVNGNGHLLLNKIANGTTKKYRLKRDATGLKELQSETWAIGYR